MTETEEVQPIDLSIKADEIQWRVGSTYDGRDGKMAMLLGYVDARLAMEKLDLLDPRWSSHMEPIELGGHAGVRCTLTVGGVSREDVGVVSDTEPLKGAFSDALKRAAVHFGIGRELYDLPSIGVAVEVKSNGKAGKPKALPVWKNGRWTIDAKLGWVKYDHEPPEEKPKPVEVRVVTKAEARETFAKDADFLSEEGFARIVSETGGEEVIDPAEEAYAYANATSPQADVVEVTPSTAGKVGRGGVTGRANSAQVGAVKAYSKSLNLGPHGVIDEYNALFAANLNLPQDKKEASEVLLTLLDAMSNTQISKLIQRLSEMKDA